MTEVAHLLTLHKQLFSARSVNCHHRQISSNQQNKEAGDFNAFKTGKQNKAKNFRYKELESNHNQGHD
jgi:hypothetical protein